MTASESAWLDVGNAGTSAIAALLRSEGNRVEQFGREHESSLLILSSAEGRVAGADERHCA